MLAIWGTKKWEICEAICIIFILGLGVYYVTTGLLTGSHIWWYDLALPFFAFSGLGLLLLVRMTKKSLSNVVKYGLNPSAAKDFDETNGTNERSYPDEDFQDDRFFKEDEE